MEKKSRKKIILWIVLSIFIILALWTVLYIHYSSPTRLAMEYLYNHTNSEGKFEEKTNVNPGVDYQDEQYNEMWHAGTLYSMYLCERLRKDKFLRDKRILASRYFIRNHILPIKDNMYVVTNKNNIANLGSTGLALAALSNLYPDGKIGINKLRGLGKFLVFMQKSGGSFYPEYDIKTGKYPDLKGSYYVGEAALGLLYLYEVDKDRQWIDSAKQALLYLSRKNINLNGENFDYWMLVATKKLLETSDNGLSADEVKELKYTAKKLADNIILKQITYNRDPFIGSYVYRRNLGNVATIIEGLNAAYYIVDEKITKKKISKAVKLSSRYVDNHQVKEGKLTGGVPEQPDWKKSLTKSHGEIRLDNVQHALSAWITLKDIK